MQRDDDWFGQAPSRSKLEKKKISVNILFGILIETRQRRREEQLSAMILFLLQIGI